MTDTGIGFALALVGSLSFGTYILPRKLSALSVVEYQYWLSLAIAPICIITAIIAGAELVVEAELALSAFSCGLLWTLGSLSYSSAVDNIGIARSTPIKNMAPVFASIYGVVLFAEFTLGDPVFLVMAVGGVLLMTGAAIIIGRVGALDNERAFAFVLARSDDARRRSLQASAGA